VDKKDKTAYTVNDYVTYRKTGVCKITEISVQNFGGQGKKEYYVLTSVYDENTRVFVPIGSELEKEIRRALTVEEIHSIIEESKNIDDLWLDDCKSRTALFEEIINSGDKVKMLWIVRAVCAYKEEMENAKKKMRAMDLRYLSIAESILSGDFAYALGVPKNEVMKYINEYSK